MAAYRGVVQPESEDKRIISAQWAKDDDIARFLKALPNWQAVQVLFKGTIYIHSLVGGTATGSIWKLVARFRLSLRLT